MVKTMETLTTNIYSIDRTPKNYFKLTTDWGTSEYTYYSGYNLQWG